jgi:hypothetical protein
LVALGTPIDLTKAEIDSFVVGAHVLVGSHDTDQMPVAVVELGCGLHVAPGSIGSPARVIHIGPTRIRVLGRDRFSWQTVFTRSPKQPIV